MSSAVGFTLIEVLVSLFLFSFMLLGIDAAQSVALRDAKAAYYAHIATDQLNEMEERLRVAGANAADEQVERWNEHNQQVLPQGRGRVSGAYPRYEIVVFWGSKTIEECDHVRVGSSGCMQTSMIL